MKFSQQKVNEIITRYTEVNINTAFLPFVDDSWELLRLADQNMYSVYVKYPKPKYVNLAILTSTDQINTLPPETMKDIEKSEKFLFLFVAVMEEIEKTFGHLSKRQREYIAVEAHEKLI